MGGLELKSIPLNFEDGIKSTKVKHFLLMKCINISQISNQRSFAIESFLPFFRIFFAVWFIWKVSKFFFENCLLYRQLFPSLFFRIRRSRHWWELEPFEACPLTLINKWWAQKCHQLFNVDWWWKMLFTLSLPHWLSIRMGILFSAMILRFEMKL